MNKTFRFGVFLTVIGATLLLVTIFRGMSPYLIGSGTEVSPTRWQFSAEEFWLPRNLRMEVMANSTVDMFILDENGIALWQQEGKLSPLYAFNNTRLDIYTVSIDRRGVYAFLFHNPSNSTAEVNMNITVYGFEQDLQWASITVTAIGAATAAAQRLIIPRFAHKNRH